MFRLVGEGSPFLKCVVSILLVMFHDPNLMKSNDLQHSGIM